MFPSRLILCPTDFAPAAAAAFDMASSLARDQGAALSVLHVAPPVVSLADVIASRREGFRDDLRADLNRLRPADPAVVGSSSGRYTWSSPGTSCSTGSIRPRLPEPGP